MALAYTAPTWEDGSGTGISASQLQAMCNCIEGLVQGSDKAVHAIQIDGSAITLTYADGTQETFTAADMKGIATIDKTATVGKVDTYTITYSDGTTTTFDVTNGADGQDGQDGRDGAIQYTAGDGINISNDEISADVTESDLDDWTSAVTASTSGSDVVAVFDNLDNSYGYDLYCADELIGVSSMTKGTGTSSGIKLTYVLTGATSGVTSCKLRILK